MPGEALTLSRLGSLEEVSGFQCQEGPGADDLQDFLRHDALWYEKHNLSRTYLGRLSADLVGFLTLSAGSVRFEAEGANAKAKAGLVDVRFAMPGVLLGRLAVDDRFRSRGFGTELFRWAVRIARDLVAPYAGCRFLFIDAYLYRREWYEGLGCKLAGKPPRGTGRDSETIKMCFDLFPPPEPTLDLWEP